MGDPMTEPRYPATELIHPRVLQSFGVEQGLVIVPKDRPAVPPPEIVHEHCSIVMSPEPGICYIIEWTGDRVDHHRVYV